MESEELLAQCEALAQRQEQLEGTGSVLRLQPGEDLGSSSQEDAAHWATVYAELVGFKRQLVAQVEVNLEQTSEEGVHRELERDHSILTIELQRLELHHIFWAERASTTRSGCS